MFCSPSVHEATLSTAAWTHCICKNEPEQGGSLLLPRLGAEDPSRQVPGEPDGISSTWGIASCQVSMVEALDWPHAWWQGHLQRFKDPVSFSSSPAAKSFTFLKSTCVFKPFIFRCTESLNIPACVLLVLPSVGAEGIYSVSQSGNGGG